MADEERQFVIDGETFRVRLHEDGGFDCEWLSGPNPGYGFGVGSSGGYSSPSATETDPEATYLQALTADIVSVLGSVRPSGGYAFV
jgi:hypothetical protein